MSSLKYGEIITLLIGLIISIGLTALSFLKTVELNSFTTVYSLLILIIIMIGLFLWAINNRVDEIERKQNVQEIEQKKTEEKLKIYERLAKIEARIGI